MWPCDSNLSWNSSSQNLINGIGEFSNFPKDLAYPFVGSNLTSVGENQIVSHRNYLHEMHDKRHLESYDDHLARKRYITEASMFDHFAQMNINHIGEPGVLSCTITTSSSNQTDVCTESEVSLTELPQWKKIVESEEDYDSEQTEDNRTLQISDDLKHSLKSYSDNDPVEKIIRSLANPKPCLAITLYNPVRILSPPESTSFQSDCQTRVGMVDLDDLSMDVEPDPPDSDAFSDSTAVPLPGIVPWQPTYTFSNPVNFNPQFPGTGKSSFIALPSNPFSFPDSNVGFSLPVTTHSFLPPQSGLPTYRFKSFN